MKNEMPRNPVQPIKRDQNGVIRFKANYIVRDLLDKRETARDMNAIGLNLQEGKYSKDDYSQFIQLIGYSIDGASELSHMDKAIIEAADLAIANSEEYLDVDRELFLENRVKELEDCIRKFVDDANVEM